MVEKSISFALDTLPTCPSTKMERRKEKFFAVIFSRIPGTDIGPVISRISATTHWFRAIIPSRVVPPARSYILFTTRKVSLKSGK